MVKYLFYRTTIGALIPLLFATSVAGFAMPREHHCGITATDTASTVASRSRALARLAYFEQNCGQSGPDFTFVGSTSAFRVGLSSRGMTFSSPTDPPEDAREPLRIALAGASRVSGAGASPSRCKSNYIRGRDPAKWRLDVERFSRVEFLDVYRGVDVLYYWRGGELEYDYVLSPDAALDEIAFQVTGADRVFVDPVGDLVADRGSQRLRHRRPRAYQLVDGERLDVACRFVLGTANTVRFDVASHDSAVPLVIDPVVSFSSFLGGSGDLEQATAIAICPEGGVVVCGTAPSGFPVSADAIRTTASETEAFVAKISSDGSELEYATYVGGSGVDFGHAIAISASGEICLTGWTASRDFPVTPTAYQQQLAGVYNAFVTRLGDGGRTLISSTLLGGPAGAFGLSLAVDGDGNVAVTGEAGVDFPTTPGAFVSPEGRYNSFVARLNPSGSALLSSAFLGGCRASAIVVDAEADTYIVGYSDSDQLPASPDAYQSGRAGGLDAFVLKLTAEDSSALYLTYLGGSGSDLAFDVAIDAFGNAFVVGQTQKGFPTTEGAYRSKVRGTHDAFIAKLDANGTRLEYSTVVGGRSDRGGICPDLCLVEAALGVAVDPDGSAYVVGVAEPPDFPAINPLQTLLLRGNAFVLKVDPAGRSLLFSSLVGGTFSDVATDVARSPAGDVYVVGTTDSEDLPVTPGVFQPTRGGGLDAFVMKLGVPVIETVDDDGVQLIVKGRNFDPHASIVIDGRGYRSKPGDGAQGTSIVSKKALRRVPPSSTVSVEVRNSDATSSVAVPFTRKR